MPSLRHLLAALATVSCALAVAGSAAAQCMLANPSFEISGSGSQTFGGWNQFGSVGSSTSAAHGAKAARVSTPGAPWGVSGYWQQLDATPGGRWSASVRVMNPSTRPLSGQSLAIVNIEWRDAGGNLISYESHTTASAATPTNTTQLFSFESGPAPTGTVAARLLLGALQGPSDPVSDVIYDLATFDAITTPSLDQLQWSDFSGGQTLSFSGRTWRVKGPGYYGPGPSLFSTSTNNIWVDPNDALHLTIKKVGANWYSTETVLEDYLGYGDYVFTTRGRLDTLDPHAVFGLFLWQYGPCYDAAFGWWNPYDEIDIEYSRWGNPGNPGAQFVAQPYDYPGNLSQYGPTFSAGEVTSHAFRWLPDRVEFRAWRGGPNAEATSTQIHAWTYTGPHLPRPERPRVHLNLWQFDGPPATNQEVVLTAFTFVPACGSPPCDVVAVEPAAELGAASLTAARPNPFGGSTAIRYAAARSGPAEIVVFDLSGRRVRTLVSGFVAAGAHEVVWDGRDDTGRPLAAGVYLYRYRTGDIVETQRVALIK